MQNWHPHPRVKTEAPFDYPTRWLELSSSENGSSYLVDLGAYGGNGSCTCKAFQFNCEPRVRRGEVSRCRHIESARRRFTDWAVAEFAKHDKNIPEDRQ